MRILGVLLLFAVTVPGLCQRAALTVPQNIAQLSRQAAVIVRGQVVSVRVEPHPTLANLTTVVVNLRVVESLKGNSFPTVTFRQFVWDVRDKYDAGGYRKGQDLLLLLNPESAYGLTSPVGMDQGRFEISRDAGGILTAVNGHGNAGLLSKMPPPISKLSLPASALIIQHRIGPVPLSRLEELIQQYSGAAR